jgi:hypothetical protein
LGSILEKVNGQLPGSKRMQIMGHDMYFLTTETAESQTKMTTLTKPN